MNVRVGDGPSGITPADWRAKPLGCACSSVSRRRSRFAVFAGPPAHNQRARCGY